MFTFINHLREKRVATVKSARETYRTLLADLVREGSLKPKDEKSLEQAVESLGFTPEQVESDAEALKVYRDAKVIADTRDDLVEAFKESGREIAAFGVIYEQRLAELNAERDRRQNAKKIASHAVDVANQAAATLGTIRTSHPHLFADVDRREVTPVVAREIEQAGKRISSPDRAAYVREQLAAGKTPEGVDAAILA